jgi:hypothetical protein
LAPGNADAAPPPYPFEWVNYENTAKEYAALLLRVSRMYDERFGG